MSGIFSGHAFGQTDSFDSLLTTLRTTGGATTGTPSATAPVYGAGTKSEGAAPPQWVAGPTVPVAQQQATYIPPAADNTTLYVVGGVAAVGILAAIFMMSGRRRVAANRRRKRSH
jgi:hypothetical protein